jgi:hypothetical protein
MDARFKPGSSGNPGGRPRATKEARFLDLVFAELDRKIFIKGGTERITALEAIIQKQFSLAISGNARAQKNLVSLLMASDPPFEVPPLPPIPVDERARAEFKELVDSLGLRTSGQFAKATQ